MSKRSKVNIVIFIVSTVIAIIITFSYFLVGYSFLENVLGIVFHIIFGLIFTMAINAWIFNTIFKKFFNKFFDK